MADVLDVDRLRPLFDVVPTEFVAARNALVKELKAAKERDTAAAVAALRRPSWVDWALNHVATSDPDAVGGFITDAVTLRAAQAAAVEGRDGPDLRGSMTALRGSIAAISRLAAAALRRADRAPDAAELGARLGEVAANTSACEQLRASVLGAADPETDDLFAGLVAADVPRARPPTKQSAPNAAAERDDHPARALDATPLPDDDDSGRPALRAVNGGRRRTHDTEAGASARREADRAAAKARLRARAPLAKALDAAVRHRAVAVEKLDAAQRVLSEAEAALAEAERMVDESAQALAAHDADHDTPTVR